jgi:ATP-dependent protease HslVU (ClpYQ) peptidase subunit
MTKSKQLLKVVQQKNQLKLDLQFFAGGSTSTLFELKQNMATIGQQLQKVENELAQKAIILKRQWRTFRCCKNLSKTFKCGLM